jgi:hypothetical protein
MRIHQRILNSNQSLNCMFHKDIQINIYFIFITMYEAPNQIQTPDTDTNTCQTPNTPSIRSVGATKISINNLALNQIQHWHRRMSNTEHTFHQKCQCYKDQYY